jgi:hypothetical protein
MTARAADFWSRRRAGVRAEESRETLQADAVSGAAVAQAEETRTDTEILAELGLPDPDAMQAGDDFAAFMTRAVPAHLRHRALRRLWTSNPVLACVDGLNDYDGDFTNKAAGTTLIKTAYQVGRGFLERPQQVNAPQDSAPPVEVELATGSVEADGPEEPAQYQPQDALVDLADVSDPVHPQPSRRMRFGFADETG